MIVTEDSQTESNQARLRTVVREFLAEAPPDYTAIKMRVDVLTTVVREEAAAAIRAPLNHHAANLPQGTYQEKKLLANWLNAEMRGMGLALRCPKSGQPSIIQATIGHNPEAGRFRLDYIDAEGRHHNQTVSVRLPQLDPMPDTTAHTPHRTRGDRKR